jgi:hypothetical protein
MVFPCASDVGWYAQVWSAELPANIIAAANAQGTPFYNPVNSISSNPMIGSKWSIHYGDGSAASGTVVTDTVQLGDLTVLNQAVEIATTMSYSLVAQPQSQGILGLGFSSLNTIRPVKQKTWVLPKVQKTPAYPDTGCEG